MPRSEQIASQVSSSLQELSSEKTISAFEVGEININGKKTKAKNSLFKIVIINLQQEINF